MSASRKVQGYAVIVDPSAPLVEMDTITCCHCQRVVVIKASADVLEKTGWCMRCMKATCGPCADLGKCTPFEKHLERMEARAATARSLGF